MNAQGWVGAAFVTACILGAACGARTGLPVDACSPLDATVELAPLDVFVVMDSSGSMDWVTADGSTKWDAMREAFAAFTADPASAGIQMALTFFPIIDPAVPVSCGTDSDCGGVAGACIASAACLPSLSQACEADTQCGPGEHCAVIGVCADGSMYCDLGSTCPGTSGACVWAGGDCDNRNTCDAHAYATPAVDLQALPSSSSALLAAMQGRSPNGGTPTLPALTGAVERARATVQHQPDHQVVVVLATDGMPTACDPSIVLVQPESGIADVTAVAAGAAQGAVRTFVIGVFSPNEAQIAKKNLDAIATAGGTDAAFVIRTDVPVAPRFLAALRDIRSAHCVIDPPGPLGGASDVAVSIEGVAVPRRASPADCDADGYYVEPGGKSGQVIVLCPSSCDAALGAPIRLSVDCKPPSY